MNQPTRPIARPEPTGGAIPVRRTWQAMATQFDVELVGTDAEHLEAVAAAIEDEVHRLDALLSRHNPASEISRLNRRAAAQPLRVDADVWKLLAAAEHFRQATDGFFDVTAASPAIRELKNGTGSEQHRANPERNGGREVPVPIFQHAAAEGAARLQLDSASGVELDSASGVELDRASGVELDSATQTVRFSSAEVAIDLGGIGKGFALDRAKELLARYGVDSALLSAGTSSILAVGRPAADAAWLVDLRHPADSTPASISRAEPVVSSSLKPRVSSLQPLGRLELVDRSLSCSATVRPGQAISDIVDPHTRLPLSGGEAVVVLAPTGVEAEALSTALLAMGRRRAGEYLERRAWTKLDIAWIAGSALASNPQTSNPQTSNLQWPNLQWLSRSHD